MRATVIPVKYSRQTAMEFKYCMHPNRPNSMKSAFQLKDLEIVLLLPGFALEGKINVP